MLETLSQTQTKRWELFKDRRRVLDLNQAQAATRLGVLQSTVSKWENMIAPPDWREWPKVAAFLNISTEELAVNIAKNFSQNLS